MEEIKDQVNELLKECKLVGFKHSYSSNLLKLIHISNYEINIQIFIYEEVKKMTI